MTIDRVTWHKSSYSNGSGGACVEVADLDSGARAVRDSKDPAGAHLMGTRGRMAGVHCRCTFRRI